MHRPSIGRPLRGDAPPDYMERIPSSVDDAIACHASNLGAASTALIVLASHLRAGDRSEEILVTVKDPMVGNNRMEDIDL